MEELFGVLYVEELKRFYWLISLLMQRSGCPT